MADALLWHRHEPAHPLLEPQIRACLARAAAAGSRPTGTAVVTYIVARKAKKLVIDSTDIDGDNTTLTDQPLVECLRDTAKAMKFAGLPHDADGIVATRRIVIDHGALVENKHVTFSYLQ